MSRRWHEGGWAMVWIAALVTLVGGCGDRGGGSDGEVVARRVPLETSLADPEAKFWSKLPETRVKTLPQNMADPQNLEPAIPEIRVRAAHDGEMLALRLEWADETESVITTVDRFGDQVAVQFPLHPRAEPQPGPMMGHAGAPVRILQWRGVLQRELTHGQPTIEDIYPNAVVDLYPDRLLGGEVVAPYRGGRAVENPVAEPRLLSPVVTHVAEGFGTLTAAAVQPANGRGVWRGRRWRVAMTYPLAMGADSLAALRPGSETTVAFAVWDGGANEVGSRKAWASWLRFRIEE